MMRTINLNDLSGIPDIFLAELSKFNDVFRSVDSLEQLDDNWNIQDLIFRIDNYCLQNMVIGFHYTRAEPEFILNHGLLARSGQEIRQSFMERHKNLFTVNEVEEILNAWKKYFDKHDEQSRDYHVFFNFTLNALDWGGAELLLKNFGGEQIYAPLYELAGIKEKLKSIGIPLIVKCKLSPSKLNTFIEYPWGKIAMSTYHRKQNSEAHQIDQDGYQVFSVPSQNIEIIYFRESGVEN